MQGNASASGELKYHEKFQLEKPLSGMGLALQTALHPVINGAPWEVGKGQQWP